MFSGGAINEESMDIYISLLCEKNAANFYAFSSTFASFSLFSITPRGRWALDIEEVLDNHRKFFPLWNAEEMRSSKTFFLPHCLDNGVWILITLKENENNIKCDFYHPMGQSMYNFLYLMR